MRVLICILSLAIAHLFADAAEKPASVVWEGKAIQGIREVRLNSDGRIVVIHGSSGFSTTEDKLPASFLKAWGITMEQVQSTNAALAKLTEADFERAAYAGLLREVNGIVYDLRRTQPDWTVFSKVRMIQTVDDGAIVLISKDKQTPMAIFVRHLPRTLADYETVSFSARLTGSFSFVNRLGQERTIRAYDAGRPCKFEEVPEAIRKEGKLWAALETLPKGDALARLPQSGALRGMGTGFFITEDGYLLTNWHVTREAKQVRVKAKDKFLAAEVVRSDRVRDLALLKIEGGPFQPLQISREHTTSLGETVFTIGFPNVLVQGLEPKYTDGKISSLAGLQDDPQQYQISVPVQPGNSGGPLVDLKGYVVGVVDAKLNDLRFLATSGSLPQNVNYAIKARVILEFVNEDSSLRLPVFNALSQPEDAVRKTEAAVAMVLAY